MRTFPFTSPPSCTISFCVVISPLIRDWVWISTRSSAKIAPVTVPPTMASRVYTSPSTTPPLAISTCRSARMLPRTVPSTLTTPLVSRRPVISMPTDTMERPGSLALPDPEGPVGFRAGSLPENIDISS